MSIQLRLRETAVAFFLENIPLKLLALGCAVAIWAWVQSEQVVSRRVRVRVTYVWPTELVQVDEVPTRLVVTLEGPQSVVLPLEARLLGMEVDLTEGVEGNNEIDFSIQPLRGLPQSLRIKQISPPGADIALEQPMEKEVPVTLSTIGQPPRGYEIRELTVDPPTVMISGPKSQIQNISQAPTDVIDLNSLREDTSLEVPLTQGGTVSSLWEGPVRVSIDIEEIVGTRTFPEVPVAVRGAGWSGVTETVRMTLKGPVAELEALDGAQLSVIARIPDEVPIEQIELQMRYNSSNPTDRLEFVGIGPDSIIVTELSPPTVVLRRMPEEE
jgi:hypothetical protein